MILSTIQSVSENKICEYRVIRYQSCSQKVWKIVENLEHSINIFVTVFDNDLEWAKELGGEKFSLLLSSKVL